MKMNAAPPPAAFIIETASEIPSYGGVGTGNSAAAWA